MTDRILTAARLRELDANRITGAHKADKSSREFWAFTEILTQKNRDIVLKAGKRPLTERTAARLRRIGPRAEKVVSAYLKGNEAAQEHWMRMVRKALKGKCPRCNAASPKYAANKLFECGKPAPAKGLTFNVWECPPCAFAFVYETV